jgi:hypothetical protein
MGRIVPTRQLFVLIQPGLRQIERGLADDCRQRNGTPRCGWGWLIACAWSNGLERRFPPPCRGGIVRPV